MHAQNVMIWMAPFLIRPESSAVHNESSLLLVSSGCLGFFETGFDCVPVVVPGRRLVPGPGSGLSEELACGV